MVESTPEWLPSGAVARLVGGVSVKTLRRWSCAGTFPRALECPGQWFYRAADVERWFLWKSDCAKAKRCGAEPPAAPEWPDPAALKAAEMAERRQPPVHV